MATTIVYGWEANEGYHGDVQCGPTCHARAETPAESDATRRAAEAAFAAVGCRPCRVRVDFFGDHAARVVFTPGTGPVNGRAVMVRI